jgi:hypothetical protein
MDDNSKPRGNATKAKIVMALVVVTAITGYSYHIAHHAGLNTPPDPFFRELVRPESTKPLFKTEYIYVPLLFQAGIWLVFVMSLLPIGFQYRWLLTTDRPKRIHVYFLIAVCLLAFAGIYENSSDALLKAAIGSNIH